MVAGKIVGAVVGSVAGAAIIAGAVLYAIKRKQKQRLHERLRSAGKGGRSDVKMKTMSSTSTLLDSSSSGGRV